MSDKLFSVMDQLTRAKQRTVVDNRLALQKAQANQGERMARMRLIVFVTSRGMPWSIAVTLSREDLQAYKTVFEETAS